MVVVGGGAVVSVVVGVAVTGVAVTGVAVVGVVEMACGVRGVADPVGAPAVVGVVVEGAVEVAFEVGEVEIRLEAAVWPGNAWAA